MIRDGEIVDHITALEDRIKKLETFIDTKCRMPYMYDDVHEAELAALLAEGIDG